MIKLLLFFCALGSALALCPLNCGCSDGQPVFSSCVSETIANCSKPSCHLVDNGTNFLEFALCRVVCPPLLQCATTGCPNCEIHCDVVPPALNASGTVQIECAPLECNWLAFLPKNCSHPPTCSLTCETGPCGISTNTSFIHIRDEKDHKKHRSEGAFAHANLFLVVLSIFLILAN